VSTHRRLDTALEAEAWSFVVSTSDGEAELAGRFHATAMVRGRPHTLGAWRVTASQPTADRIAQLLGGCVQRDSMNGLAEIQTSTSTVNIVLIGPDALAISWRRAGSGTCDGASHGDRQPCTCPAILAQRRVAAKQGRGCQPRAEILLRLRDDPALGLFSFLSEDWSFVELVTEARVALRGMDRPAAAQLGLNRTLHMLQSGKVLAYTMPVLTLLDRPR
jgi:hypothetical protein